MYDLDGPPLRNSTSLTRVGMTVESLVREGIFVLVLVCDPGGLLRSKKGTLKNSSMHTLHLALRRRRDSLRSEIRCRWASRSGSGTVLGALSLGPLPKADAKGKKGDQENQLSPLLLLMVGFGFVRGRTGNRGNTNTDAKAIHLPVITEDSFPVGAISVRFTAAGEVASLVAQTPGVTAGVAAVVAAVVTAGGLRRTHAVLRGVAFVAWRTFRTE